jgi:hypothetical protein
MTDTTNKQTAASQAPSHIVYHVRDREGGEARGQLAHERQEPMLILFHTQPRSPSAPKSEHFHPQPKGLHHPGVSVRKSVLWTT